VKHRLLRRVGSCYPLKYSVRHDGVQARIEIEAAAESVLEYQSAALCIRKAELCSFATIARASTSSIKTRVNSPNTCASRASNKRISNGVLKTHCRRVGKMSGVVVGYIGRSCCS
jgi:hypothetical protein